VVGVLYYKAEGRGSKLEDIIIHLPNPFNCIRPWGSTQPLTEMGTKERERERERVEKSFWIVEYGRCIKLTNSLPPVSQLSRKFGILNITNFISLRCQSWR
jgi:hypothetical protein